jgi:hypothetical protein
VESTSLVLVPHPATQAKAATLTTPIAIRWIEFISLVFPQLFTLLVLRVTRDTPGCDASRRD